MDKIASGYGVAVRQPEGGYSFHKLDDNSQVSESEIIKASSGNGNIVVNGRGGVQWRTVPGFQSFCKAMILFMKLCL